MEPQPPCQRPLSPWSDESSSDSEPEEVQVFCRENSLGNMMRSIESMLHQLGRIAVLIRQSGSRSRLEKADRRFDPNDHHDFRSFLAAVILSSSPKPTSHLDLSKLTDVQSRLIANNMKRRNRFLYAQKHAEHLEVDSTPEKWKDADKSGQQQLTRAEATIPDAQPIVAKHINKKAETVTTATIVEELSVPTLARTPSGVATTQMSRTGRTLVYPRPPQLKQGREVFWCPCCCQVLPAMFREKNRWR